jgi:hypothetical protein
LFPPLHNCLVLERTSSISGRDLLLLSLHVDLVFLLLLAVYDGLYPSLFVIYPSTCDTLRFFCAVSTEFELLQSSSNDKRRK